MERVNAGSKSSARHTWMIPANGFQEISDTRNILERPIFRQIYRQETVAERLFGS